ncbi:hypothetical protein F4553_001028 [Allocatelliglobosispora scoriae]|uniref:DUF3618 domain-containing protein n=1 Tax=Allocatelliglobosispora scoriae TaxID=643052 RepID=A0A841BKD9_9ACTN|nr:hypothetical protein [Allocatelliglobosispora scoriae]MBB5867649.1 hypothetical protein [Allocatelliglobosispora scoriae]
MITRRQDADVRRAWDELVATLTSAKETTVDQAKGLFNDAQDTVSDTRRVASRRLHNAAGALAGRPTPPRWGLIAVAGVVGVAVGAAAIVAAANLLTRSRKAVEIEEQILGADEILSPAERDRIISSPKR